MALFPNRQTEFVGRMNAFWIEPAKRDVMGYKLKNVSVGDEIPVGTPICTNEAAKTAKVCRYAHVLAVSDDKKTLTVERGHQIKSGDTIIISGGVVTATVASVTATSITLSSALSSANATAATGNSVYVGSVSEGVASYDKPNRIISSNVKIDALHDTCAAAHSGIVLANVVNYPAEFLNSTTFPGTTMLVGCPHLTFTIQ